MIIAVPVDEMEKTSPVCISFGRAPFYLIFDDEKKTFDYFDNNSAFNAQGGAGIKAAQSLVDRNVDVVITYRCGENASKVLGGKAKIYKAENANAKMNIEMFIAGNLQLLNKVSPGLHGHAQQSGK
ncbi:MAG: NifB/NifX family molybdenum-iron cluster-binding protein [Sphaerochaetaceae bacterium]|nr:NifB/NifX family molybdenum-iron cluster-binding protein [Sphaerochaetaceae bacterium]